jgi:hypothetical protein
MSSHSRQERILNGALFAVALALVVAVFATRHSVTTSEEDARSTNILRVYREGDITRLRVERKEGSFTVVRTKTEDGGVASWSLKEPIVEDAEPFGVQKLLGTLEFASYVRQIKPEEVNRTAFGLDDPELVVHVDMGSIRYRIRVGREAPSPAGAHYVEIAGEDAPAKGVVIATKSLLDEMNIKLDEFRERYVMPYLSPALDRIVIEGLGGVRKLRRGQWQDGWRFDGMMNDARVGRAGLDRMLSQFARTRAEHFIDAADGEKALAGTEVVKVTLVPSDKKSKTGIVEVGGVCPGSSGDIVALRREPDRLAACVPKSVLSGLSIPAEGLVDRTLFWMRPDEVESFEVENGGAKLALDRKESGFVMRAPRQDAVDAEAGNGRIESVCRATGAVVTSPDKAAVGLDPPHGSITMRSAAADDSKIKEETVLLGTRGTDGRMFVERKHDGAVLELSRDAARVLTADSSLVRKRTLLDVPIAEVARVEVDGKPHQIVERAESGTTTLKVPSGFAADGALSLELFDAMRALTADHWVADADDGTFGLEPPSLSARLSVRKDGRVEEHVLRVGKATVSGYFAAMQGDPGVFVLPRRVHETLTTLVLDRSLFMMDASITGKVTLTTPDKSVVFEKRGDEFVQTDTGDQLSPESIQKIVETLSAMRAEAAIELGPSRPEHGLSRPVLTVRLDRESGVPGDRTRVYRIGSGDSYRGVSIHYARAEGADATFGLLRSSVRAVLDAL